MSGRTFDDYIQDIPMDLAGRLFIPNRVPLPSTRIPSPLSFSYPFTIEQRARSAYDKRRKADPPPTRPTPISSLTASQILMPSKANPVPVNSPNSSQPSFEDFESANSVFDDLALKTIDDRTALSQIWGGVKLVESTGTASYSCRPPSTSSLPAIPNLNPYPQAPSLSSSQDVSSSTYTAALLKKKLITKGFKSHLVNICVDNFPQEKMTVIEFYLKALSNMEKKGVQPSDGLSFLLESDIEDKETVLRYADTVVQLVGMGFGIHSVLAATRASRGDRVAALDQCLSSNQ